MKQLGIILPDDLAANNIALKFLEKSDALLIYEPCDTFYQINHHKQKIAFLISALRHWKEELQKKYAN
ncbi:MAG: cryptochrome/photolyase family protein, partial [Gammaproteobacteria bacterium]